MSAVWRDTCRKSFDDMDQAVESVQSGVLLQIVRPGAESALNRVLDRGYEQVSPLVLEYVKVSPQADWFGQTMCVVEVVHSCELEEIAK